MTNQTKKELIDLVEHKNNQIIGLKNIVAIREKAIKSFLKGIDKHYDDMDKLTLKCARRDSIIGNLMEKFYNEKNELEGLREMVKSREEQILHLKEISMIRIEKARKLEDHISELEMSRLDE